MKSQRQSNDDQHEDEIGYWLRLRREAGPASLTPLEDAAKQVVVITSLLQGIYFAAISFSGVKQVGTTSNIWFNVFIFLTLLTVIFWMTSLYFATRVFVPESYKLPESGSESGQPEAQAEEIRRAYESISTYKHGKLTTAVQFLCFSFIPFAANVIIYLALLPAPPPK